MLILEIWRYAQNLLLAMEYIFKIDAMIQGMQSDNFH